jgi:tRNA 2-thiocytidine biosynthesis protein TtcA
MKNHKSFESSVIQKVNQKVGKAIQKYHLIDEGDRILVGLSGGKDSMVLLETLAGRLKYHPLKFELSAIHISLKSQPYSIDLEYLKSFAEQLHVPFISKMIDVDLFESGNNNPCFVCSWNRRKALFETAQELGYNKLALGHHMDDAIETLLMNMAFQSSISSMPPILRMFDGKLFIVRPLSLLTEQEVREFAVVKNFRKEIRNCLYEKDSKRKDIKKMINQLAELNPNVRSNIYASMTNIQNEYLPTERY